MKPKTRLFSIIIITIITSVGVILFIDSYSFLPKTVLRIDALPRAAEVLESGSSGGIGAQSFANEWLIRISAEQLPVILSGRSYSSCSGLFNNGKKMASTLQLHKEFSYSNCYEYYKDNSYRIVIYANSMGTMLLVEYTTK